VYGCIHSRGGKGIQGKFLLLILRGKRSIHEGHKEHEGRGRIWRFGGLEIWRLNEEAVSVRREKEKGKRGRGTLICTD
jgi:hypothetical protein